MEVTGLVITGVTGTDTMTVITGGVDIILTTIPVQIMVMHMAMITLTEEGLQGMVIIPMKIILVRLVAEEMITSSVHGVREHQPPPKVLQRVQDLPLRILRSVIQEEAQP
jgi:hypothetical protein